MTDITIRPALEADARAMARLAALDSADRLTGRALIAEVCGEPVAALDIVTGRAVADPFRPTADVVELLRMRAAADRGRERRRSLLPQVRFA